MFATDVETSYWYDLILTTFMITWKEKKSCPMSRKDVAEEAGILRISC